MTEAELDRYLREETYPVSCGECGASNDRSFLAVKAGALDGPLVCHECCATWTETEEVREGARRALAAFERWLLAQG